MLGGIQVLVPITVLASYHWFAYVRQQDRIRSLSLWQRFGEPAHGWLVARQVGSPCVLTRCLYSGVTTELCLFWCDYRATLAKLRLQWYAASYRQYMICQ